MKHHRIPPTPVKHVVYFDEEEIKEALRRLILENREVPITPNNAKLSILGPDVISGKYEVALYWEEEKK